MYIVMSHTDDYHGGSQVHSLWFEKPDISKLVFPRCEQCGEGGWYTVVEIQPSDDLDVPEDGLFLDRVENKPVAMHPVSGMKKADKFIDLF